jgi:hypothetical protein
VICQGLQTGLQTGLKPAVPILPRRPARFGRSLPGLACGCDPGLPYFARGFERRAPGIQPGFPDFLAGPSGVAERLCPGLASFSPRDPPRLRPSGLRKQRYE